MVGPSPIAKGGVSERAARMGLEASGTGSSFAKVAVRRDESALDARRVDSASPLGIWGRADLPRARRSRGLGAADRYCWRGGVPRRRRARGASCFCGPSRRGGGGFRRTRSRSGCPRRDSIFDAIERGPEQALAAGGVRPCRWRWPGPERRMRVRAIAEKMGSISSRLRTVTASENHGLGAGRSSRSGDRDDRARQR